MLQICDSEETEFTVVVFVRIPRLGFKYSNRLINTEFHTLILFVSKYELRADYVPGRLLCAGGSGLDELDMDPVFTELASYCLLTS